VRLDMMSVEECARITVAAIEARKRGSGHDGSR
jgi:hypothetical protein